MASKYQTKVHSKFGNQTKQMAQPRNTHKVVPEISQYIWIVKNAIENVSGLWVAINAIGNVSGLWGEEIPLKM